jgi:hypothetical protein
MDDPHSSMKYCYLVVVFVCLYSNIDEPLSEGNEISSARPTIPCGPIKSFEVNMTLMHAFKMRATRVPNLHGPFGDLSGTPGTVLVVFLHIWHIFLSIISGSAHQSPELGCGNGQYILHPLKKAQSSSTSAQQHPPTTTLPLNLNYVSLAPVRLPFLHARPGTLWQRP